MFRRADVSYYLIVGVEWLSMMRVFSAGLHDYNQVSVNLFACELIFFLDGILQCSLCSTRSAQECSYANLCVNDPKAATLIV